MASRVGDLVECPACHGQGEREHRVFAAGASPFDSIVRCDLCLGLKQVAANRAEHWRRFPTIPPRPGRRFAA
jgi:hypothetical protein